MLFVLALAAGTGIYMEHKHGLELEHEHGQAAWPLEEGDEELIQQVLALLPAKTWTWEFEEHDGGSWTWPLLQKTHESDSREAMTLHMLHRHGLAPLVASHDMRFGDHLRSFRPEEADRADLDGHLGTKHVKTLVLAEQAFRPVAELRSLLSRISLSGLRNLHSYDHDGHWRCTAADPQLSGDGGVTQVAASQTALQWLGTQGLTAQSGRDVQAEFNDLFNTITADAWDHPRNMDAFLSLGNGSDHNDWGAIKPIDAWVTDQDRFSFKLHLSSGQCYALGQIVWQEAAALSLFMVPLEGGPGKDPCPKLMSLYGSGSDGRAQATAAVSQLVRAWVDDALQRHRDVMGARRSVLFAEEESRLLEAGTLAVQPTLPSRCPKNAVRRHQGP